MISTTESAGSVFVRGAMVVCKGDGEGPYAKFEGRVAAAHENVIHLDLARQRDADALAHIGQIVALQVVAGHGWFVASGRRIQNVVPGGMTVRIVNGPTRLERREYLRVRCSAPFWWRPVQEQDIDTRAEDLKANLRNRPTYDVDLPSVRDIGDPDLERLMKAMIRRIETLEERVAELTKGDRPGGEEGAEDQIIDISGAGMRFASQSPLKIGDVVEAALCMEDFGQREIKVMAKVVRIDPPNLHRPLPGIACCFLVIDDRDRELIIRYTFREHRRQLRESLV